MFVLEFHCENLGAPNHFLPVSLKHFNFAVPAGYLTFHSLLNDHEDFKKSIKFSQHKLFIHSDFENRDRSLSDMDFVHHAYKRNAQSEPCLNNGLYIGPILPLEPQPTIGKDNH